MCTMLCRIERCRGRRRADAGAAAPEGGEKNRVALAPRRRRAAEMRERWREREKAGRAGAGRRKGPQVTGGGGRLAGRPATPAPHHHRTRDHLGPRRAVCRLGRDEPQASPAGGRARHGQATPGRELLIREQPHRGRAQPAADEEAVRWLREPRPPAPPPGPQWAAEEVPQGVAPSLPPGGAGDSLGPYPRRRGSASGPAWRHARSGGHSGQLS